MDQYLASLTFRKVMLYMLSPTVVGVTFLKTLSHNLSVEGC
jgi:hypothetical protein